MFYRFSHRFSVSGKYRAGSNFPIPGYYTRRGDAYFVSEQRNALRLPSYARLDLRANRTFDWSRKRLTLFAEVINVLNNDKLVGWTTTVTPDPNSPVDELGLRTGFVRSSNFGNARDNGDYPRPLPGLDGLRTFQVSFGFRF